MILFGLCRRLLRRERRVVSGIVRSIGFFGTKKSVDDDEVHPGVGKLHSGIRKALDLLLCPLGCLMLVLKATKEWSSNLRRGMDYPAESAELKEVAFGVVRIRAVAVAR